MTSALSSPLGCHLSRVCVIAMAVHPRPVHPVHPVHRAFLHEWHHGCRDGPDHHDGRAGEQMWTRKQLLCSEPVAAVAVASPHAIHAPCDQRVHEVR